MQGIASKKYVTLFLLLLALIIAFVPLTPKLPTANLDDAWALGLNQALAQGFAFGKQIIFTLGPYSALYTKAYHPATAGIMFGGCLYIALSFWLCLLSLSKNVAWTWVLALVVVFAGMLCSRDSLFFSYDLVAGLAACKILLHQELKSRHLLFLFLIFVPFGLLILIKGTLLILSIATVAIVALFYLINKKFLEAFISVLSVLLSTIIFWLACHQELANLPAYLTNSITMAFAFTQAMSSNLDFIEIGLFLANTILILCFLGYKNNMIHWAMLCLFAIFLLLSFKAGFTRHYSHIFIAATSLVIAAFLLPFCTKSKYMVQLLILTLINATYVETRNARISILGNARISYQSFWHGLHNWLQDNSWLQRDYDLSMIFLKQQTFLPQVAGTTDIYSYNITHLIASGNQWLPRPIFQSYSVFNADFANKNKQHLASAHGPGSIFFKLEPIDGRLPSLEDGASWPVLLNQYELKQQVGSYLLLEKRSHHKLVSTQDSYKQQAVIGDTIAIPQTPQQVIAVLEIKPSLLGKIATLVLAPSDLFINLELTNGAKVTYKLIANMAEAGFLLSPLIESTDEFAKLLVDGGLDSKKVAAFSVTSPNGSSWFWKREYRVLFRA